MRFWLSFILFFAILSSLFCGSDSEELNCKDICAKLKECEGDDETECNKSCNSMSEKNYLQDSYIKALNKCPQKPSCDEFSKCEEQAEESCTSVDVSSYASTICGKRVECKLDDASTKEECINQIKEGTKDNCASKSFYDDFEKCVNSLSCEELKTKGTGYCEDKILGGE